MVQLAAPECGLLIHPLNITQLGDVSNILCVLFKSPVQMWPAAPLGVLGRSRLTAIPKVSRSPTMPIYM